MSAPQITVLIPAYNAARTIEAALFSVLNQSTPEWEVVVVDDGSIDDTLGVVERVRSKVRQGAKIVPVRLPHGGCAAATHAGILRARTDLVTILDADDILYSSSLRVLLSAARPELCYLWTKFVYGPWEQRERPMMGWARGLPDGYVTLKETFLRTGWWGASHQRCFRRSVYLDLTPHLDQRWQTAVDLQLCLLLAGTGKPTRHIPEVTYYYRKHRPQMSTTRRDEQRQAHTEMLGIWREVMQGGGWGSDAMRMLWRGSGPVAS